MILTPEIAHNSFLYKVPNIPGEGLDSPPKHGSHQTISMIGHQWTSQWTINIVTGRRSWVPALVLPLELPRPVCADVDFFWELWFSLTVKTGQRTGDSKQPFSFGSPMHTKPNSEIMSDVFFVRMQMLPRRIIFMTNPVVGLEKNPVLGS